MKTIKLDISTGGAIPLDIGGPDPLPVSLGINRYRPTGDYNELENKPSIEGHTLVGNSLLPQIGVHTVTPQDIDNIIYG